MLDRTFLAERRRALRAVSVGLKPASVQIRRGGATVATVAARVNYPNAASREASALATDAAIVSLTVVSDDPALDIRREDRVVCVEAGTERVSTGRVIAVRAEPWGVEADVTSEQ